MCPTNDLFVQPTCYRRPICPTYGLFVLPTSYLRPVCPTYVLPTTCLSYLRPTYDLFVHPTTYLSYLRPICPTYDLFVLPTIYFCPPYELSDLSAHFSGYKCVVCFGRDSTEFDRHGAYKRSCSVDRKFKSTASYSCVYNYIAVPVMFRPFHACTYYPFQSYLFMSCPV